METVLQEKAANYFSDGHNCCQSVLLAASDYYQMEMSEDVITAAQFFREGMASGCACGALVGAEMALAIYLRKNNQSLSPALGKALYQEFTKLFGSSCCKVLRKKQGIINRVTNKGCREITALTAGLLDKIIKGKEND